MDDFGKKLAGASEWLRGEYAGIRTGQAAPSILDSVKVESYGALMPVNQVASIGIEDARTLRVSPWDTSVTQALERAIMDADLGVGVVTDSSGLRVTFPELTGERRASLLKLAKGKLEDARVRIRSAREEKMKGLDAKVKSKEIGEDEAKRAKDIAQKQVDDANKNLEALYAQKEKEINN